MTSLLIDALSEPLRLLSMPSTRTWWPALVGALLIATVYELIVAQEKRKTALTRASLFSQLLHPSSRVDLKMMVVRGFVRVFIIATLPWTARYISVKTINFAYWAIGPPPVTLSSGSLIAIYSISFLFISDLSRYVLHRMMHTVPPLWRLHQVHHSAEVLTPFTLYRLHPIEQALHAARGLIVVGICAGIFAWISYGKATIWTLYGVPSVIIIFSLLGANLRHSHVWLTYPAWVEHILISPAQHQQHHELSPAGQQRNYGSMLAVWDWIYGTLKLSREGRPDSFGLAPNDRNHNPQSLLSAILSPLTFSKNASSETDRAHEKESKPSDEDGASEIRQ